jgi:hypothetical protein
MINLKDYDWKELFVMFLIVVFVVCFVVTYISGTICIMSIEPPAR